ncbi:hypothetical protein [Azospirillum sp. B510]|uniref:hypothetical protein n=1 Tax=Azospirillum sp. (strain B510) TaxID=137722 RepID=UPI0002D6845E|nr:hypothetical protein [Azospirillum sp. B510]
MITTTWIVAESARGTDAIVAEACAASTVDRFFARADARGMIVDTVKTAFGCHWDGSRLDAAERRRIAAGIRRNA